MEIDVRECAYSEVASHDTVVQKDRVSVNIALYCGTCGRRRLLNPVLESSPSHGSSAGLEVKCFANELEVDFLV